MIEQRGHGLLITATKRQRKLPDDTAANLDQLRVRFGRLQRSNASFTPAPLPEKMNLLFSYRVKQLRSHFRTVFNLERVRCWNVKVISFGHDTGLCLWRISWIGDDELNAPRLKEKTDSFLLTCPQKAANRNYFFSTRGYFLSWFIMPYAVCIGVDYTAPDYELLLFGLASWPVQYEKGRSLNTGLLLHVVVVKLLVYHLLSTS